MGKDKVSYICNNCGASQINWSGKCSTCNKWNTLEENIIVNSSNFKSSRKLNVEEIDFAINEKESRLIISQKQINDLLGGGIVRGSLNLIAGEPGVGKSTLLMQLSSSLDCKVLYVSGEESLHQIALRAKRLNLKSSNTKLANSNSTDEIINAVLSKEYDLVIIDSIQTISLESINSAAGNVSQITNSTNLLVSAAKRSNTAVILVGHVTKEGYIAGPKILEHLVDVVLNLEGDKLSGFKTLRASKNRFGSINDVVLFEMQSEGLVLIDNPSQTLLSERLGSDGSVVHASMQGSRPMLVEIQALVNRTSYGYPKRTSSGFDINRLNLIIAVLEKRTKLKLSSDDIFINVIGGIKLAEPAADLAIAMAIASAKAGIKVKDDFVVFGEIGLSGEIRHVPFIEKRSEEAFNLGFKGVISPKKIPGNKKVYVVNNLRDTLIKYLAK